MKSMLIGGGPVNAAVRGPIGARLTNSHAGNSYLSAQVLPLLSGAVTTSLAGLLYEALSKPRVEGAGALALAIFITLIWQQVLCRQGDCAVSPRSNTGRCRMLPRLTGGGTLKAHRAVRWARRGRAGSCAQRPRTNHCTLAAEDILCEPKLFAGG